MDFWQISLIISSELASATELALEDLCLSTSRFEADEAGKLWQVDLLFSAPPELDEIKRRFALLEGIYAVRLPEPHLYRLPATDWLAHVQRELQPMHIGRYFVHGSHYTGASPPGAIPLRIDAGLAFGSGEHATTAGCLLALDRLARKQSCRRIVDMGCGSAILGIAAAKTWRCKALAADIDPVAVRVARENARINRARVMTCISRDFESVQLRRHPHADLIFANILALPLVRMANPLCAALVHGGAAVLSGLLASQERYVLHAYRQQGMRLEGRIAINGWHTLMLRKP